MQVHYLKTTPKGGNYTCFATVMAIGRVSGCSDAPTSTVAGSARPPESTNQGPHLSPNGSFPAWGFPKIRGTILGVPIIRTVVFGGLYWEFPI